MKLTINANGFASATSSTPACGGRASQQTGKNVFGGNLNTAKDPMKERMEQAKKQAWKVVSDAWDSDKAVDDQVEQRRGHYQEMQQQKKDAQEQLSTLRDAKNQLKEEYQIEDGMSTKDMPQEYLDRVAELNDQMAKFQKDIEDADRAMQDDTSDIHKIGIERLKNHAMVDAQNSADDIMGAANDEILQMATQEAMDNINEKMDEAKEKADKKMEEKEEDEERLEKIKEDRAMQEALIEGTKEAAERAEAQRKKNETPDIDLTDMMDMIDQQNGSTSQMQQELSDIKSSMKVLEADLKGIKVDQGV